MNTLIEAHRRKLEKKCSITSAIEGLADELYEMRKESRDLNGELKNIAIKPAGAESLKTLPLSLAYGGGAQTLAC